MACSRRRRQETAPCMRMAGRGPVHPGMRRKRQEAAACIRKGMHVAPSCHPHAQNPLLAAARRPSMHAAFPKTARDIPVRSP